MKARCLLLCLGLALSSCNSPAENDETQATPIEIRETGILPNIAVGDVPPEDRAALKNWIEESVALLQSPVFEANYLRAADLYPRVYVSKTQDIIPTTRLLSRLKMEDPLRSDYWWPKTFVVLEGPTAVRSSDRLGFGFDASRKAAAGPYPLNADRPKTGEIELGRLHFARYTQGDAVEKSCALNTMTHEISHTLSDKADRFWMHILDTEENTTPPYGVFEASYFIGTVAQCTYLQSIGRVSEAGFQSCLLTFSSPGTISRFKSLACDDFPDGKAITPSGRLAP